MKKKKLFYKVILIVTLNCLLLFTACVTTKNTPIHRGFHNMNARYNGYFLANEEMKETIKKIEKEYKDDFTKLIPLFIYPTDQTAKGDSASFNKVIKRATSVIHRHAIITEKGKVEIANACKWIDENYTVIGIADLYKRELFPALEIFEYVSKKYPDPEAKYRGEIWMMRTFNEVGSFSKTEILIDEIKNEKDFPKDKWYKRELALVSADLYIKRNNYPAAIKALNQAIPLTKKKLTKARYYYVLAQLYAESGQNQEAIASYDKALKYHPSYEMVFNAKINKAFIYALEGDSKGMKNELIRMAKDIKNEEYLDQIYYALALLTYKEGDVPSTIKYLDKSIENSVTNTSQKALSFLKRGDVYFDMQNYKNAELNYDSAITILPKEYPNYAKIEEKKKSLTTLVENLNIITLEDSLQTLAKMSEKDRKKAIDKMIKRLAKEEQERQEEEKRKELIRKELAANNQTSLAQTTQNGVAKSWYFYNPDIVNSGIADFNKKWGNRKLEDDWRRSQKQQAADLSDEDTTTTAAATPTSITAKTNDADSVKDRDFYLKTIPSTPEALEKSTVRLIDAYYNVGVIYREQFNNNEKSVNAFEELLSRYPDNKYKITVYYHLYRTYLAMKNNTKANYYKNLILDKYPETEYAKIIKNPNLANDLAASKNVIEKLYSETYQLYTGGKYKATIEKCNFAESQYSKNYMMPQFDFLKAMSIGKTQDRKALEAALTEVIIKHPTGQIKDKAQQILDLLNPKPASPDEAVQKIAKDISNGQVQNKVAAQATLKDIIAQNPTGTLKDKAQQTLNLLNTKDFSSATVQDDNVNYYWLTIVTTNQSAIKAFKEKVGLISDAAFPKDNLVTLLAPFDKTAQTIVVKTLKGKIEAKKYFDFMKDKDQVFYGLEKNSYQTFIISATDYILLQKDKDITKYLTSFNEKFQ